MNANPEGLKKFSLFHILIIATFAIGLYSNTLKNGFIYDDEFTIINNTFIKSFDNLPLLFDKIAYFSHAGETSYRPVVTLTYFIDYALYGLNPWGYHLTNILLHTVNGVFLYSFLSLLFTPHISRFMSPPFLISIIFVSHPVLTEAVNCISYREDLLAFLFYMVTLSLYLILRQQTSNHRPLATAILHLLSCLIYILALLSKEMAVTLPFIVICYEWLYGKENTKLHSRLFNRYSIGYITITFFYLYLRFYLFHNPEEQIWAWSLAERVLTLPWLIRTYLKLSLFPVQLSADYVVTPVTSPFSTFFILSITILVSIFTIILRYFPFNKRGERGFENGFSGQGSILFGAIFFLITLMPIYNLVPLFIPFAERYLYLPVAGFIMFAVYITYLIAEKLKIRPDILNRYISIFLLIVLILFSFSVVKRNTIWRDGISLWSDTVAKMPSSKAYYNLGNSYLQQNLIDQAIKEYLTAIRLRPNNADAHINLGGAYSKQGRSEQAIKEFIMALKLKPDLAEAHNNLGVVYLRQGRYDKAMYELKMALNFKPDYLDAYINLGITYSRQGLFNQAIKEYLAAIRLKSDDASAHYNLGAAYYKQGRYDEAISEFSIALKLKPDYKEAYQNLKSLMGKKENLKMQKIKQPGQDNTWSP